MVRSIRGLCGLVIAFSCAACAAPVALKRQEFDVWTASDSTGTRHYDVAPDGTTRLVASNDANASSPVAPRPGTVPVTFSSVSDEPPLSISTYIGRFAITSWRGHVHVDDQFLHLCTTPCALNMLPGKLNLRVDGDGGYRDSFEVPPSGADVMLRPLPTAYRVGGGLIWAGIPLTMGGVAGLIVWGADRKAHDHGGNRAALGAGAGLLGAGQLLWIIGGALAYSNASGVVSVRPKPATQPTAKLTVGPGSLGVTGTF